MRAFEAIDALEAQISEIAKRLESERDADAEPSPLDKAMDDLMRQIESMREGAVEAAERAAKAAIADTLEALPKGDSPGEIDFLSKSLADLKDLQNAAEQRSMDTLGSVQGTLDKLVERLTLLESKARAPQTCQSRTRQCAIRQGPTRQGSTREGRTRQGRTRQGPGSSAGCGACGRAARTDDAGPASRPVEGATRRLVSGGAGEWQADEWQAREWPEALRCRSDQGESRHRG